MKPIVLAALITPCCLLAQSFETASFRATEPGDNGQQSGPQVSPRSFVARGATLRSLIQWAWDVPPLALSGSPQIDQEYFDVAARTENPASTDELRIMLRHLLSERLALQTHIEKKEMRVYALTVAPNGPKFNESLAEGSAEFTRSVVAGKDHACGSTCNNVRRLAAALAKKLNELIVDETGLKGHYDLNIDITAYANGDNPQDLGIAYNDVLTILFSSLPAQTGLKLTSRREPVELLIVDNVGMLREN